MSYSIAKFTDANVFIYAYLETPQKEEAMKLAKAGTHTDSLVLIETFSKLKTITKDHDFARRAIRQIAKQYVIAAITTGTVFEAVKHEKLQIADAIHLVCSAGCELFTFDKHLKEVSRRL